MAETRTYTYEEIQRYLQHKMDAKEMHAFERAMMDDPFLADAIEGYRKSNDVIATSHLNKIDRQLSANKQPAKVVPLPLHKTAWWKVAAIVFIIVSGGALSYMLFNNPVTDKNTTPQIARTESKEIPVAKDSIRPAENAIQTQKPLSNESLTFREKTAPVIGKEPRAIPGAAHTTQTKQDTSQIAMADKIKDERETYVRASPAPVTMAQQSDEAGRLKRMSASVTQNEFKGKVIDTSGKPLPFASVVINNSNSGTNTDSSGNFILKAPDSVLQVNVSSVGFAKATAKIKSDDLANRIILKEDRSSLNEVVVGYGTTRKKNLTGSVTKIENKEQSAGEPKGGWKNFDAYLKREIQNFKDSTHAAYNKPVSLEFSVDEEGHPKDIQIQEDADKAVADKAIQILKNGPRWKRNKNQSKVKVIMPF